MDCPRLPVSGRAALAILSIGFVAAGLASPPIVDAAFPGRNGHIAASFAFRCGFGMDQIATMRPDGSDRQLLTPAPCEGAFPQTFGPDWSSDGERLLFVTDDAEHGAPYPTLAIMEADGSGLTGLPVGPVRRDEKPSLAPDGEQVVFTRDGIAQTEIWRARLDGSHQARLRAGSLARWSPNGRRIAYVSRRGALWLMDARTRDRVRRLARRATSLDWAPDGRRLVYARRGAGGRDDLFVVGADGNGRRRLTSTAGRAENGVVWSPNGRRLAFVGHRYVTPEDVEFSIWTMSTDGTRVRRIFRGPVTPSEELPSAPIISWQPR